MKPYVETIDDRDYVVEAYQKKGFTHRVYYPVEYS